MKKTKVILSVLLVVVVVALAVVTVSSETLMGRMRLITPTPASNLIVTTDGSGDGISMAGLPSGYDTELLIGDGVEVYRFTVTNNQPSDIELYKVTAEYSVYAAGDFAIGTMAADITGTNAWTLYNADDLSTPLAHGTIGDYGLIPFVLTTPSSIGRGTSSTFVVATEFWTYSTTTVDAELNVWLQEDAVSDKARTYIDVNSSNFIWASTSYGFYNGYYVDDLPSYGQRHSDEYVTRGMLCKMLVEDTGATIDTTGGPTFPDVDTTNEYYDYIETAVSNGWIDSYDDGTFAPDDNVNRAEAAKIAYVAYELTSGSTSASAFPDVDADAWYFDYVSVLFDEVPYAGYVDGGFGPGETLLRSSFYNWLSFF